ncbi:hypothetical protein BDR26DRAFT_873652 [Obelidium mucronatum]|nr:hypothetical protein BDR26DRAFT_873652 [Obelidium mucronatum]
MEEGHTTISTQHHLLHHSDSSNLDDPPIPPLSPTRVLFDPISETVTIVFPHPIRQLDPTVPLTLHITYTGTIGYQTMHGFYKSPIPSIKPPQKPKFIAATHFEPLNARRAFPCFDEPHFKLFWSIVVAVPKSFTVVSNMPVQEVTGSPLVKNWNIWRFYPGNLVAMPSYLVAWGIGEVDYVEETALVGKAPQGNSNKKGIKVRGFVYEGVPLDNVRFSVDVAVKSLEYYETLFGVPFPLPKMDLWPMPDFSGEAMENWGLCIFASVGLFTETVSISVPPPEDGSTSTSSLPTATYTESITYGYPDHQIYVSNLVAHEIAHHWVGDLVTMKWWNSLWLNEGFAEWAQYPGTNATFPDWNIYKDLFFEMEHEVVFAKELGGYTRGTGVEKEEEVGDVGEVVRMFDALTYSKGACIIRMFEGHLASAEPESPRKKKNKPSEFDCSPWCRVMRNYLSTWHDDVYNSIDTEDESGLVSAAMQGWIEKEGVPVVWVDKDGAVRQERMLAWRNVNDKTPIPPPKKPKRPKKDEKGCGKAVLQKRTFRDFVGSSPGSILSNDTQRVLLANPGRLGTENPDILAPIDRAGLVSDSLPILAYLGQELHPTVWRVAVIGLKNLLSAMELHEGYIPLYQFIQTLVFPVADFVGWWSVCTSAEFQKQQLRSIILPFAATLRHTGTIAYSLDLFGKWTGPKDLPVLLQIVYESAVIADPIEAVKLLRNESLGFPGDFWSVSPFPAHLKSLLLPLDDGDGKDYVMFAKSEWLKRVEVVASKGGQVGIQLAWDAIRWSRVRKGGGQLDFGSMRDDVGRFNSVLEPGFVAGGGGGGGEEETESLWDLLVSTGGPNVDRAVEAIVASAWKDGLIASGGAGGKESFVITSVKRGLQRASAADKFRRVLGESVNKWLVV